MSALRTLCIVLLLGIQLFAQERRPNILLAIADDWGKHAGAYGTAWVKTPNFDRIAKEGVLFRSAFTNNPKCSPSRASLLTGRNSWQNESGMVHFGHMPGKWPVYPDLLEKSGYFVGFTGKGWGPGDFKSGGFQRNPAGPAYNQAKLAPPADGISRNDYPGNFAAFLAARPKERPFSFWFGCQEPHRAYEPGSGERAGKRTSEVQVPAYYPQLPAIRSDFLDYAVEVEWFDAQLGKMLAQLESAGELENTIIVVTSDHGQPFPRVKGQVYEDGIHIPLAIRWGAKVPPGRMLEDFVNLRDLAPTLLQLSGVERPASMTGHSLAPALLSSQNGWFDASRNRMVAGRERHDTGRPDDAGFPVRVLRTPEWFYVRNYAPDRWPSGNPETGYRDVDDSPTKTEMISSFDRHYKMTFGKRPAEELYYLPTDAACTQNVAEQPQHAETLAELRAELESLLRKDGDPRVEGRGEIFDTYPYLGRRDHAYDTWLKNQ